MFNFVYSAHNIKKEDKIRNAGTNKHRAGRKS